MSFSNQVKTEICEIHKMPERCKVIMLYGILFSSKTFSYEQIEFLSESSAVAEYTAKLIGRIYKIRLNLSQLNAEENIKTLFQIKIDNPTICKEISDSFNCGKYAEYVSLLSLDEEITWSFVKGLFLSCGSVSDPETNYHLEFYFKDRNTAFFAQNMLSSLNLNPKFSKRRNGFVVYFKDSSAIEDVLAGIGAVKSVLQLMDSKVIKDIRNKINRQTNCETANMKKTIGVATEQVDAINIIYQKKGTEFLTEDLKKIAEFRLANPNMSLTQMSNEFNGEFSKSGIDRRLKKLVSIAAEIKQEIRK